MFRENSAQDGGGAIQNNGGDLALDRSRRSTSISPSTLQLNKANLDGAVFQVQPAVVTAKSSIFSLSLVPGSIDSQLNCDGFPILFQGFNLSSDNACGEEFGTDLCGLDPNLGPIANHGGPTRTHLPQSGSPVVNAATNVGCPATDQRGAARPQNGGPDRSSVTSARSRCPRLRGR